MTALPDPAELAPTRDPAAYGRSPLMSRTFWAMIVFGAVCLLCAVVVAFLGPRIWPARQPAATQPLPPPPAFQPRPEVSSAMPPPSGPPESRLADLQVRVSRLETSQSRIMDVASEALAAASLSDAASRPGPFADALYGFEQALPASANIASLRVLALQGAPTRTALAAELGQIATRISVEAHAPNKGAGVLAQIGYAVSRIVSIRRTDGKGAGSDGALALAQRLADDGDLTGAVRTLDARMPPAARASFQGWRERALRRIAIDEAIAGLRTQAIADLATTRAIRQ